MGISPYLFLPIKKYKLKAPRGACVRSLNGAVALSYLNSSIIVIRCPAVHFAFCLFFFVYHVCCCCCCGHLSGYIQFASCLFLLTLFESGVNIWYQLNRYFLLFSVLSVCVWGGGGMVQGPVVQNLTKMLANVTLHSVLKYGKYIDIFAGKHVSSFCIHCKSYSHFSSKNTNVFENTLTTIVNKFVINEFVKLTMLWTTGPWCYSLFVGPCDCSLRVFSRFVRCVFYPICCLIGVLGGSCLALRSPRCEKGAVFISFCYFVTCVSVIVC